MSQRKYPGTGGTVHGANFSFAREQGCKVKPSLENLQYIFSRLVEFTRRHNARGNQWYTPMATAVSEYNCVSVTAYPEVCDTPIQTLKQAFKPCILLVRDDGGRPVGPLGFDQKTLRSYLASCRHALISASEPDLQACSLAASYAAVLRVNTVIIKTDARCEVEWLAFVRKSNPDIEVRFVTLKSPGVPV